MSTLRSLPYVDRQELIASAIAAGTAAFIASCAIGLLPEVNAPTGRTTAILIAEEDDATCVSFAFSQQSADYVICRATLDNLRHRDRQMREAAF